MAQFTKQQLREALQKLPEHIQDIILSVERSEALHDIMNQHGLTVGEMSTVVDVLAPVSFGLVHPDKLAQNLRVALPLISAEKIDQLIAELNERMLGPIRAHILEASHHSNPVQSTHSVAREVGSEVVQAKFEHVVHSAPHATIVHETTSSNEQQSTVTKPPLSRFMNRSSYPDGADPYRESPK